MSAFSDTCLKIEVEIEQLAAECRSFCADVDDFEQLYQECLRDQVGQRLLMTLKWVGAEAIRLSQKHGGEGYVFVALSNSGETYVTWFSNQESVSNREVYKAYGITVMSLQEFSAVLQDMLHALAGDDWHTPAAWLAAHGLNLKAFESW